MTASMLKYILVVNEMTEGGTGARSVDIADRMKVARASVCKAVDRLADGGYAYRDNLNRIRLTARGREVAEDYLPACEYVAQLMEKRLNLSSGRARKEALAVLGALSGESVAKIKSIAEGVKEE